MSEYAVMEKAKRKIPAERSMRTSPDYAGLSPAAAGLSNQAMLTMLGLQSGGAKAPQGQPLAGAMRARFERQFGLPMDDVRVHQDSGEPAKFGAGACAYGSDIFIGPEQEDLLEHEMTHVAQQKMGQVRPTGMEHGVAVNRSPALEHSADTGAAAQTMVQAAGPVVQCGGGCSKAAVPADAGQRAIFTREMFRGVSMSTSEDDSKEKIGSIYFGGTSLDDKRFDKKEKEKIPDTVLNNLNVTSEIRHLSREKEKSGMESMTLESEIELTALEKRKAELEKKLRGFLRRTDRGGRIRAPHSHAPGVFNHAHILRMPDPRAERRGMLLELLWNGGDDKIHTHPSRGRLVASDHGGIVDEMKSRFSTADFEYLMQEAQRVQQAYERAGRDDAAADSANRCFYDAVQRQFGGAIPMYTEDEIRRKREGR